VLATELSGKRLEMLREIIPTVSRVAMLWNDTNLSMVLRANETQDAAAKLGVTVQSIGVHDLIDFEGAFKAVTDGRAAALVILADPFTIAQRKRMVEFARVRASATCRLRTFDRMRLFFREVPRGGICAAAKKPLFDHAISDLEQHGVAQSDPAPWGKDAPLGRDIERSVTIVITPILSGRHHCYARYDFGEGRMWLTGQLVPDQQDDW
jgi:hypothetical protein